MISCCSAQRDMVKTYGIGHRLLEKVFVSSVSLHYVLLRILVIIIEFLQFAL